MKKLSNDEDTGVPDGLDFAGYLKIQRNEDGDKSYHEDDLPLSFLLHKKMGKPGKIVTSWAEIDPVLYIYILLNRSETI